MPALNMKLPAQTSVQVNDADKGQAVICDPFSGPTGSPFDNDAEGNYSTGALSTGIGFGANHVIGTISGSGFTDNYTPGVTKPDNTAATTAILTTIGGGHSDAAEGGIADTTPYDVQPLLHFGQGAERDAGSYRYTGHAAKLVTATGSVANGSAIETGFENRSGVTLVSGQSAFGMATADSAAIAPDYLLPELTGGDVTPAVTAPATTVDTYEVDDGVTAAWSIYGGADEALFEIVAATGALSFADASVAGTYEVIIQAVYNGNTNRWLVTVTVS